MKNKLLTRYILLLTSFLGCHIISFGQEGEGDYYDQGEPCNYADWNMEYYLYDVSEVGNVVSDIATLVNFYQQTNGSGWTNNDGWETLLSAYETGNEYAMREVYGDGMIHGVVLNAEGRVTELNLSNNNISGSLPSLTPLVYLEKLDLSSNQLQEVHRFCEEQEHQLPVEGEGWEEATGFESGMEIWVDPVLCRLKIIDFSNNQLEWFDSYGYENYLPALEELYLAHNRLEEGPQGNYYQLRILDISDQDGNGTINYNNIYYPNLEELYIRNNHLYFSDLDYLVSELNYSVTVHGHPQQLLPVYDYDYYPYENEVTAEYGRYYELYAEDFYGYELEAEYIWYRNNEEVYRSDYNDFIIESFDSENNGVYHYEMIDISGRVPDLVLESERISLFAEGEAPAPPDPDRAILNAIYAIWKSHNPSLNLMGWGSDLPLNQWEGISTWETYYFDPDTESEEYVQRVFTLDLQGYDLGSLPAEIGQLEELIFLYLPSNNLSGTIPEEIGDLSYLQQIFLDDNQLSGQIPESIGYLYDLTDLTLWRNQLTGAIPTSFENLTPTTLDLSDNQLSEIPSEFQNCYVIPSEEWEEGLNISGNQFSFEDLFNIDPYVLETTEYEPQNILLGSPQTITLNDGETLSIEATDLGGADSNGEGSAEIQISWRKQRESGVTYPVTLPTQVQPADAGTYVYRVSHPNFPDFYLQSHPITLTVINQTDRRALEAMYETWGRPEALTNWGTGTDIFTWKGVDDHDHPQNRGGKDRVTTLSLSDIALNTLPHEIGNLEELRRISMFDCNIQHIPESIGQLNELIHLTLSFNSVTSLPESFSNLQKLKTLNIIYANLGNDALPKIYSLPEVYALTINSNQFSGEIPAEFGQLSDLKLFELANNKFTGTLPTSITTLSDLFRLHINGNELSEPLPAELVNMPALSQMDIYNNRFTFEDLEPVKGLVTKLGDNFRYYPQKPIDEARTIEKEQGESWTFTAVDALGTEYKLYKQGEAEPIITQTHPNFELTNLQPEDAGEYYYTIAQVNANDPFPDLVLESFPLTLFVSAIQNNPAPQLVLDIDEQIYLSGSSINLKNQLIDLEYFITVTLKNIGDEVWTATGDFNLSGSEFFTIVGSVPSELAPNEGISINIKYHPTSEGEHTSSLIFDTDFTWSLTGNGMNILEKVRADAIAYYPFDVDANDYSGNGYHGNISGGVQHHSYDSCEFSGIGYAFDGVDDKVETSQPINIPNDFSFTFRIKPEEPGTVLVLGDLCPNEAPTFKGNPYRVIIYSDGSLALRLVAGSGNFTDKALNVVAGGVIDFNKWQTITINYNNQTKIVSVWKNNQKVVNVAHEYRSRAGSGFTPISPSQFPGVAVSPNASLDMGADKFYCGQFQPRYYKQSIDELYIHDRLLTLEEIDTLHQGFSCGVVLSLSIEDEDYSSGTVADFGTHILEAEVYKTLQITNIGDVSWNTTNIVIPSGTEFHTIYRVNFPTELAPQETLSIPVIYSPTSEGKHTTGWNLQTDAKTYELHWKGSGERPRIVYPNMIYNFPWVHSWESTIEEITNKFNHARMEENRQLNTNLQLLVMPTQAIWDNYSSSEKALWLINKEREDRGLEPFAGIETALENAAYQQLDHYGHNILNWDYTQLNTDLEASGISTDKLQTYGYAWLDNTSYMPLPIEQVIYMFFYADIKNDWATRSYLLTDFESPPYIGTGLWSGTVEHQQQTYTESVLFLLTIKTETR